MSKFTLTGDLKIVGGDNFFNKILNQDFNKKLQSKSSKISTNVKSKISTVVSNAMESSPTVTSLLSGTLKDDFGLTGSTAQTAITNIINYLSDNFELLIKPSQNKTVSEIVLEFSPTDMSKLVSVPGGSFMSTRGPVNWLEWLLTSGTQVVVGGFWLMPNAQGRTRSGGTKIMQKIGKTPRDAFRVDPNHSGTENDNFIIRALQPRFDDILGIVAEEVIRSI